MSSLLDDCLTRRRDLVFGGTRYNLPGVGIFGPSNVVDSFSAIQRFVCDEKRLTWGQLRQALLSDFTGHEAMRQELAHGAPLQKFAGCVTPDEVGLSHRLFTAALKSHQNTRVENL